MATYNNQLYGSAAYGVGTAGNSPAVYPPPAWVAKSIAVFPPTPSLVI